MFSKQLSLPDHPPPHPLFLNRPRPLLTVPGWFCTLLPSVRCASVKAPSTAPRSPLGQGLRCFAPGSTGQESPLHLWVKAPLLGTSDLHLEQWAGGPSWFPGAFGLRTAHYPSPLIEILRDYVIQKCVFKRLISFLSCPLITEQWFLIKGGFVLQRTFCGIWRHDDCPYWGKVLLVSCG